MSAEQQKQEGGQPTLSPQFHVAHHFGSATLQFDSGRMGMWLFMVTEILLFAGMFCGFAMFRSWHKEAFLEAGHHLNPLLGGVNTVVLICSSLTMALGVRAAQMNKKKLGGLMLALTAMFALTFLVIHGFEYYEHAMEGMLPGKHFSAEGFKHHEANIFFGLYYMMTGIHSIHVIIGIGLIVWIFVRNAKGHFSQRYYAPVELVGIYWHLVDMIWIYLFPLLYLIG